VLMGHDELFIGAAAFLRSFAALHQPLDACAAWQPKISLRSSTGVKDLPLYQRTSIFSVRNAHRDSFSWIGTLRADHP
jgi:hypothetical protein